MTKVIYDGLEWEVIDDRHPTTILISRNGSLLRVQKRLTQSKDKLNNQQLKVKELEAKNAKLMTPVDVEFLFNQSSIDALQPAQLDALERFIHLRANSEASNNLREKQQRQLAEKCYCLSIKQPWADAILKGCKVKTLDAERKFKTPVGERVFKDIENRQWRLPSRHINTRTYIHASKGYDKNGEAWLLANGLEAVSQPEATLGAILGSVIFLSDGFRPARPWSMKGQRHWEIYSPLLLPEPIPYKGKLKFYELDREGLNLPSYDEEIKQQKLISVTQ